MPIAYTNVPEKYSGLYKMFIRWGRSNVRENIAMAKYVFTDFREGSKTGSAYPVRQPGDKAVDELSFILVDAFLCFNAPGAVH